MSRFLSVLLISTAVNMFADAAASTRSVPAKAVFWSPTSAKSTSTQESHKYQTKSIVNEDLAGRFVDSAAGREVVAFFQQSQSQSASSPLSHPILVGSIDNSDNVIVMPHIYASQNDKRVASAHILSTELMKGAKKVSLAEFSSCMRENKDSILSNGATDAFIVSVDLPNPSSSVSLLDNIAGSFSDSAVLFATTEDSQRAQISSKSAMENGHYSRILLLSDSNAPQGSIYYKPSGAEYSIYYANTYLYLTPDVFTGIMTGLFMFFVLLIGLSCLSSIQGPATFASKLVPVGKEA